MMKEVEELKREKNTYEEKCDVQAITVDVLERLIRELRNDHVRRSEALTKEVKRMKWNHFHKIKKRMTH